MVEAELKTQSDQFLGKFTSATQRFRKLDQTHASSSVDDDLDNDLNSRVKKMSIKRA